MASIREEKNTKLRRRLISVLLSVVDVLRGGMVASGAGDKRGIIPDLEKVMRVAWTDWKNQLKWNHRWYIIRCLSRAETESWSRRQTDATAEAGSADEAIQLV